MKRHALLAVLALAALGLIIASAQVSETPSEKKSTTSSAKPAAKPAEKPAADAVAALSAKPTAGDDVAAARYAWFLFIQAMTPTGDPDKPLTFENWAEQCELNPNMLECSPSGPSATSATSSTTETSKTSKTSKARKFHGSPLRAANVRAGNLRGATATATATPCATPSGSPGGIPRNCNPMNTQGFPGVTPPPNVCPAAIFCEEVFVNGPEKTFITANKLTTLQGQQAYSKTNGAITFPWDAVEIKVDWVPASSLTEKDPFQCPDKNNKLYTEVIDGVCYAMVGVHISSKVLPDWLWATFEPDSELTNPNRCNPDLYSMCEDPWGTTSTKPYKHGHTPPQSDQLKQAMTVAKLNQAFNHYYLTGVQTEFVKNGKPVPLSNSFIEFNAGVAPGTASCITCHRYAYFDGNQPVQSCPAPPPVVLVQVPEDNFGGPPNGWSSVGYACSQNPSPQNCTPVVPGSTSQDFSWLLGSMPYGPTPTPTTSD